MMDINYFLDQAQNSYQQEFNDNYADVIIEITDDFTMLITEDGYAMTIDWTTEGEFNGYNSHNDVLVINKKVDSLN